MLMRWDFQETNLTSFILSSVIFEFLGKKKFHAQSSRWIHCRCESLLMVLIWPGKMNELKYVFPIMALKNSKTMCVNFRPESSISQNSVHSVRLSFFQHSLRRMIYQNCPCPCPTSVSLTCSIAAIYFLITTVENYVLSGECFPFPGLQCIDIPFHFTPKSMNGIAE